ncbi:MAG TPA: EAL domain-containing protein [Acidimicrobiales bacterium]|nr:EAL domain-containing protein [Acidimicrobiales bacterium]
MSTSLVLISVGVVLQVSQAAALRRILIDEGLKRHEAEARLIERTFREATDASAARREVGAILAQVQNRPDVANAFVVDSTGTVIVAGDPDEEGKLHYTPAIEAVLRSAKSRFISEEGGGRPFEYLTPVELPTGRVVLEVEEMPLLLEQELAALRRSSLGALGASLLIALPLLWLLGGRSLAGRYQSAEERSSRDGLTGLANHRSFQEEIRREVARSLRHGGPLSLAMVDVDDFKVVNDQAGHRHGDEMLVELGAALGSGRLSDRAFRIGGDEFAVILPQTDCKGAVVAADRLRVVAADRLPGTTISIGLATLGPEGDSNVLRDQADAALYEAKRLGRDRAVSFHEAALASVLPAAKIHALRSLLEEGRLGAVYQPIWKVGSGEPMAFEGLTRPSEEYGFDGPLEAFQVAERIGKVDELDALCRRAVLAGAEGLPPDALLFVNVSPQVLDHESLAGRRLVEEVEAAGLGPERVVIEITERSTERLDVVMREAARLRQLGFKLALDDVGSGNAGLEMLLQVRFDFVKVDRGVVDSVVEDGPGRAVMAAVCAFASEACSFVIAEGIQTQAALDSVERILLRHHLSAGYGVQGFFLGRPAEGFEVTGTGLPVASSAASGYR